MEGQEGSAPLTGVYARKSTGLVREGGAWSVLIYNINFVSIGMMTLFTVLLIPAFYPGGNMQLALLICLVIVLPTSMVFAMFSAAMPRSGGDYVYVSRVLGPSWGMMSNWNQTVWWILYGGVPSAFFAYYGLTPLFRSLGVLTATQGLIDFGDRLSTPTGAFLTGTLLIVVLVAIFAFGLNTYFKVQNVLFVVALIGAVITILVLAGKDHAAFVASFNQNLADAAGTSDPYGAVLKSAKDSGFTTAPFSLYWTIIPMTWIYLELVFNQSSAYIGGEVKRPGRVQLWSMPFAAIVSVAIAMLTVWALQHSVGTTFLGAVSWDNGATLGVHDRPDLQGARLVRKRERPHRVHHVVRLHLLVVHVAPGADQQRLAEPAGLRDRRRWALVAREGERANPHSDQRLGRDGARLHRRAVVLHAAGFTLQDIGGDLRVHPVLHRDLDRCRCPPVQTEGRVRVFPRQMAGREDPRDFDRRGALARLLRVHGLGLPQRSVVRALLAPTA